MRRKSQSSANIKVKHFNALKITPFSAALCEVFDKADITRDGTISIAEYMALCDEYGVRLTDDDVEDVRNIADADGEVGVYKNNIKFSQSSIQVHRNDFILHIKNSRLLKQFEVADPASEFHWKKKADLAFRYSLFKNTLT